MLYDKDKGYNKMIKYNWFILGMCVGLFFFYLVFKVNDNYFNPVTMALIEECEKDLPRNQHCELFARLQVVDNCTNDCQTEVTNEGIHIEEK